MYIRVVSIPGNNPASSNLPMDYSVRIAKMTKFKDGGIKDASVPAQAMAAAPTPGLYPRRTISGKAIRVNTVALTIVDPDTAQCVRTAEREGHRL
jgi:hypothetical protein